VPSPGEGADREAATEPRASEPDATDAPLDDGASSAVHRVRLDWRSAFWIGAGVLTGLLALALVRNVSTSITRVGIGLLLAFALDPVVVRIRARFGFSRPAAVLVVGGAMGALFAFLIFVLGPPAVEQAQTFGRDLPDTVEQFYGLPVVGPRLEEAGAADRVREWAESLPSELDTDSVADTARRVLDGVLAASVVALVGLTVLVDGDLLVARLMGALPESSRPNARRVGHTFYRTIGAYFAGSLLVACLAATYVLTVGLALGVPLAPAAALWVLVVNLIPQIGGFLGGSVFTVLGLTESVMIGLICLALFLLWMNLENHVIQPAVVGQAVNLSPPTTMLAALVGGAAAGIPGALVATPLLGASKSLYLEIRTGKPPDLRQRRSLWAQIRGLFDRFRRRGATPDESPPDEGDASTT
jgi:putative heme transporter